MRKPLEIFYIVPKISKLLIHFLYNVKNQPIGVKPTYSCNKWTHSNSFSAKEIPNLRRHLQYMQDSSGCIGLNEEHLLYDLLIGRVIRAMIIQMAATFAMDKFIELKARSYHNRVS